MPVSIQSVFEARLGAKGFGAYEVALLVVHGILHLLGHDHAEPEEEAAMKAIESRVLATLFPGGAFPGGEGGGLVR